MDFKNDTLKSVWYFVAVILLGIMFFLGIFPIPAIALIVVLSILRKKSADKNTAQKNFYPLTNNVQVPQLHPTAAASCPTSNSDDNFCHTQHHAQRMTADAARSELQELRSLLDSGMMEKAEYNYKVSQIKAVLK